MPTGAFWNVDDPLKPWGYFDPDDKINIPFDFSDWLTAQGTAYASHVVTPNANLEATTEGVDAGVVVVQVSKAAAGALTEGEKYGVTCQVTAADGQKQSQTLWLKIKEL